MTVKPFNDFQYRDGSWAQTFGSKEQRYITRAAQIYASILERCASRCQARRPKHAGCSNGFQDFQEFAQWFTSQPGYRSPDGAAVDKDLLIPGNRRYSKETCVVLPGALNSLVQAPYLHEGVGVLRSSSGMYRATLGMYGKAKYLGSYASQGDARQAYLLAKVAYARQLAYENRAYLCDKAFAALSDIGAVLGLDALWQPERLPSYRGRDEAGRNALKSSVSNKTYNDTWVCPAGHTNTTVRKLTTAGKRVTSFCQGSCQRNYQVTSGPAPERKDNP